MKKILRSVPNGVTCLLAIVIIFGSMASVMGISNMLNTIMNTAHQLLLNTVFYLMGMCVITGALGKVLVEFGVVDLLQRILRPVMKPLFNMPGVASLGAVLTFLSDNPAIIALSQDKAFAQYFKKYQHVSLVNFGTAFGMGLLVIIFMVGQGFYSAPFIGLFAALCGCVVSTRLMQYFTCKDFPEYRFEDAVPAGELEELHLKESFAVGTASEKKQTLFVRILNAMLDGGKEGVNIGLAIIPGVLIISTFVMMLTFGASTEIVNGKTVEAYTGAAFQGTYFLPWLASQIDFVFDWLFGFTAPELVSFPITALGAVGAALSLIPEFARQGILDENAIAVFTAMGMCWSGYLSTDAATLDSLGYRALVPRAFISTFLGGICAGIIAHWAFVTISFVGTIFAPTPIWESDAQAWNDTTNESINVKVQAFDDGSYTIKNWYGKDADLEFRVKGADSTVIITNAYSDVNNEYYFVHINEEAKVGHSAYAVLYPSKGYSRYEGDSKAGCFYIFAFVYDKEKTELNRCYYEVTWGGRTRQTIEDEKILERAIKTGSIHKSDSIALKNKQ